MVLNKIRQPCMSYWIRLTVDWLIHCQHYTDMTLGGTDYCFLWWRSHCLRSCPTQLGHRKWHWSQPMALCYSKSVFRCRHLFKTYLLKHKGLRLQQGPWRPGYAKSLSYFAGLSWSRLAWDQALAHWAMTKNLKMAEFGRNPACIISPFHSRSYLLNFNFRLLSQNFHRP